MVYLDVILDVPFFTELWTVSTYNVKSLIVTCSGTIKTCGWFHQMFPFCAEREPQ